MHLLNYNENNAARRLIARHRVTITRARRFKTQKGGGWGCEWGATVCTVWRGDGDGGQMVVSDGGGGVNAGGIRAEPLSSPHSGGWGRVRLARATAGLPPGRRRQSTASGRSSGSLTRQSPRRTPPRPPRPRPRTPRRAARTRTGRTPRRGPPGWTRPR